MIYYILLLWRDGAVKPQANKQTSADKTPQDMMVSVCRCAIYTSRAVSQVIRLLTGSQSVMFPDILLADRYTFVVGRVFCVQYFGYVLYRHVFRENFYTSALSVPGIRDRGYVLVNGVCRQLLHRFNKIMFPRRSSSSSSSTLFAK